MHKPLKKYLRYDPETGFIHWNISPRYGILVGDVAGCITNGYIKIRINRKAYNAHRLAFFFMKGHWPKKFLDHINGIRSDNRWCNLREATRQQNSFNRIGWRDSQTKTKGVTKVTRSNKFQVRITIDGQQQYLGCYNTIYEARDAYNQAARKYHGQFFREHISCQL